MSEEQNQAKQAIEKDLLKEQDMAKRKQKYKNKLDVSRANANLAASQHSSARPSITSDL